MCYSSTAWAWEDFASSRHHFFLSMNISCYFSGGTTTYALFTSTPASACMAVSQQARAGGSLSPLFSLILISLSFHFYRLPAVALTIISGKIHLQCLVSLYVWFSSSFVKHLTRASYQMFPIFISDEFHRLTIHTASQPGSALPMLYSASPCILIFATPAISKAIKNNFLYAHHLLLIKFFIFFLRTDSHPYCGASSVLLNSD